MFFFKKHVIVIGLSRIGTQIAINLSKAGRNVIVISNEPLGPDAEVIKRNGGFVIFSKGFDERTLKRAGLANASTVFIASSDDDINIKLAQFISRLKKRKYFYGNLKLMVHINNSDLKNLLSDYLDISSGDSIDLQPFNINDVAAKLVYDQYPPHLYLVDQTAKDNEKIIGIVGDNEIAKSFLIENSILSQYGDQINLKVLLINENADSYLNSIIKQYPNIGDLLQLVSVELKNENFSSKHQWDENFLSSINSLDAVYFFGNNDAKLINSSLHLRKFLYEKTMNIRKIPIIVCLPEDTMVVEILDVDDEKTTKKSLSEKLKEDVVIHLFRKFTDSCSINRMIDGSGENDILAKAINYYYSIKYEFDNLLYINFKKSNNNEFIKRLEREIIEFKVKRGDPLSQIEQLVLDFIKQYTKGSIEKIKNIFSINRSWGRLTDRKKESNRYVARHISIKTFVLKKIGVKDFSSDEINLYVKQIAPIEHNRWTAEKLAFDFSFGKLPPTDKNLKSILKDTLKVHDQLLPFNQLDEINKEKDIDMFYLLKLLQKIKDNIKD